MTGLNYTEKHEYSKIGFERIDHASSIELEFDKLPVYTVLFFLSRWSQTLQIVSHCHRKLQVKSKNSIARLTK